MEKILENARIARQASLVSAINLLRLALVLFISKSDKNSSAIPVYPSIVHEPAKSGMYLHEPHGLPLIYPKTGYRKSDFSEIQSTK